MKTLKKISSSMATILVLSMTAAGQTSQTPAMTEVPETLLPDAVISLAYFHLVGDSCRPDQLDSQGAIAKNLCRLDSSFQKLGCSLQSLGEEHESYLISYGEKGGSWGYHKNKQKTDGWFGLPQNGQLFVTTPIPKLGGKVLVIAGWVGPQVTVIFSVDQNLNAELVYDSLKANSIDWRVPSRMGSIYRVAWVKPNRLILYERMEPGSLGTYLAKQIRRFELVIKQGQVEVHYLGGKRQGNE